jgi:hypothetical protein
MGVRLAVAAFAAVVLASGARAAPPHLHLLSSGRIAADLAAGRSVVDDHASIAGDVDLRHARQPGQYTERVRGLFVCTSCRFVGSIVARYVVFDRGIDLTGSTIAGSLDLHGSSFREPALFGGVRQTGGSVDFGFTSFDDLAVFRGATFEAESSFASAQFRSVARFGNATFGRRASFDDAIFSDDALFSGATFTGLAGFSGALLGSVTDFRNAKFLAGATFEEASLLGRAEFSRALMVGTTKFLETRFGSDVLFIGTNFSPTTGAIDPSVQFENATAQGRIDLADARLSGSATFNNVDAGRLSFLGMEFNDPSSKLGLTDLAAKEVALDSSEVSRVDAAKKRNILDTAEETAKSSGDLRLANDLHYRIQTMASNEDWWLWRILDHAFYRGVAGYFVVPFRPLYWLLGLVLVAAALRTWRLRRAPPRRLPSRSAGARLRRGKDVFVHALEATLLRRERLANEPPPLRRLELAVYAALVGCFLLALANTNPTLRDMVDAVL